MMLPFHPGVPKVLCMEGQNGKVSAGQEPNAILFCMYKDQLQTDL